MAGHVTISCCSSSKPPKLPTTNTHELADPPRMGQSEGVNIDSGRGLGSPEPRSSAGNLWWSGIFYYGHTRFAYSLSLGSQLDFLYERPLLVGSPSFVWSPWDNFLVLWCVFYVVHSPSLAPHISRHRQGSRSYPSALPTVKRPCFCCEMIDVSASKVNQYLEDKKNDRRGARITVF